MSILSIRQRMQDTLYQTADAGDSIRQRMQESLLRLYIIHQMQETLYQTADAGDTLSDS